MQFSSLKSEPIMRMKLENFNLDQFNSNLIGAKCEFQDLWRIVRLLLILSHGIASVESGFSVNSDIMLQNMKKQSLVGQRIVYDYLSKVGGFEKVLLNKQLLQAFRSGRSRYQSFLVEQKNQSQFEKEAATKKEKLEEEVEKAKQRKRQLLDELAEQEFVIIEGNKKMRFNK